MEIPFTKYHGTGNDFIIVDDRSERFDIHNEELIRSMCCRRFGIGADGLILLRDSNNFDFQMVYFNSDGNQSSMCGNGGRCIVHFAHSKGLFKKETTFSAIDGRHDAQVKDNDVIKLKMNDVDQIFMEGGDHILNTGSPHFVQIVKNTEELDVKTLGAEIRYSDKFRKEGINVNFLEIAKEGIRVATYERGVEDETYSCGTGVTASALIAHLLESSRFSSPIHIETKGGNLKVYFERTEKLSFSQIWLEGPAKRVFEGTFES